MDSLGREGCPMNIITHGGAVLFHRLRLIPAKLERQTRRDHLDVCASICWISSDRSRIEAEEGPVVLHAQNNPVRQGVVDADPHHPSMLAA